MQFKTVGGQQPLVQDAINVSMQADCGAGGVEVFRQLATIHGITQGQADPHIAFEAG
ncbi:hypothetical protein D3C76_1544060 [compost metagenome]